MGSTRGPNPPRAGPPARTQRGAVLDARSGGVAGSAASGARATPRGRSLRRSRARRPQAPSRVPASPSPSPGTPGPRRAAPGGRDPPRASAAAAHEPLVPGCWPRRWPLLRRALDVVPATRRDRRFRGGNWLVFKIEEEARCEGAGHGHGVQVGGGATALGAAETSRWSRPQVASRWSHPQVTSRWPRPQVASRCPPRVACPGAPSGSALRGAVGTAAVPSRMPWRFKDNSS